MKIYIQMILMFSLSVAYSQDYITPQSLGASFVKDKNAKTEKRTVLQKTSSFKTITASRFTDSDPSLGASFVPVAFDDNLGIINSPGQSQKDI